MKARVRFAPSPTGRPHIGNIRTALFNWLWARHTGGEFILRIEDTDRERYTEDALEAILDGMKWIGLDWDEGPDKGGEHGPYFQSERLPLYHKYALELLEKGHAYWCDATKEELDQLREYQKENNLPTGYDGRSRDKNIFSTIDDPNTVLRFRMPKSKDVVIKDSIRGEITVNSSEYDDQILLKSDGYPTYHFAVVVDDQLMGITHTMRGQEYISSAIIDVLLYEALGWDAPEFVHLPVILGGDKTKLSKRHGSTCITDYRDLGFLPEAVFNFMALMGWASPDKEEILTKEKMIESFDLSRINKSPAVFDIEKLTWMNGEYLRTLPAEELDIRLRLFYDKWGWKADDDYLLKVAGAMQDRLKLLTDMNPHGAFFFKPVDEYEEKGVKKHFRKEGAIDRLTDLYHAFGAIKDWNEENLENAVRALAEKRGEGAGKLIHPMRLATSGLTYGPSAFDIVLILGKDEVLERLVKAWEYVEKLED